MNGNSLLIMLIVGISIAATGAYLYTQVITDAQESINAEHEGATTTINNVILTNITDNKAQHVRITVTTDGSISLNDTLITLRTPNATAKLQYRNGTLTRNTTTGFYTT